MFSFFTFPNSTFAPIVLIILILFISLCNDDKVLLSYTFPNSALAPILLIILILSISHCNEDKGFHFFATIILKLIKGWILSVKIERWSSGHSFSILPSLSTLTYLNSIISYIVLIKQFCLLKRNAMVRGTQFFTFPFKLQMGFNFHFSVDHQQTPL